MLAFRYLNLFYPQPINRASQLELQIISYFLFLHLSIIVLLDVENIYKTSFLNARYNTNNLQHFNINACLILDNYKKYD